MTTKAIFTVAALSGVLCTGHLAACSGPVPAVPASGERDPLQGPVTDADDSTIVGPSAEAARPSEPAVGAAPLTIRCEPLEDEIPICGDSLSLGSSDFMDWLGEFCPEVEATAETGRVGGRPALLLGDRTGSGIDLCGRTICNSEEPVPCGAEIQVKRSSGRINVEAGGFDGVMRAFDEAFDLDTCLAERAAQNDAILRVGDVVGLRVCVGPAGVVRACASTPDAAANPCVRHAFGCLAGTRPSGVLPVGAFQWDYRICAWFDDETGSESCGSSEVE